MEDRMTNFIIGFFKFCWNIFEWIFLILFIILIVGFFIYLTKGKIYLEIAIIIILIGMYLFWKLWFKSSTKKLLKNYNPENDRAKKTEKQRAFIRGTEQEIERRESTTEDSVASIDRQGESKGRESLQTTTPNNNRKDGKSVRKNGSSIRRFLIRRRN